MIHHSTKIVASVSCVLMLSACVQTPVNNSNTESSSSASSMSSSSAAATTVYRSNKHGFSMKMPNEWNGIAVYDGSPYPITEIEEYGVYGTQDEERWLVIEIMASDMMELNEKVLLDAYTDLRFEGDTITPLGETARGDEYRVVVNTTETSKNVALEYRLISRNNVVVALGAHKITPEIRAVIDSLKFDK